MDWAEDTDVLELWLLLTAGAECVAAPLQRTPENQGATDWEAAVKEVASEGRWSLIRQDYC